MYQYLAYLNTGTQEWEGSKHWRPGMLDANGRQIALWNCKWIAEGLECHHHWLVQFWTQLEIRLDMRHKELHNTHTHVLVTTSDISHKQLTGVLPPMVPCDRQTKLATRQLLSVCYGSSYRIQSEENFNNFSGFSVGYILGETKSTKRK